MPLTPKNNQNKDEKYYQHSIVHYTWFGKSKLPEICRQKIETFAKLNMGLSIIIYVEHLETLPEFKSSNISFKVIDQNWWKQFNEFKEIFNFLKKNKSLSFYE